ncbi:hypothetical protein [Pseudokineococcus sp. 1T1Z-3]|uniref:hypothetical protein n=1 Tax=Pseudokineococcus sp. 1T1Z-3 TaxID=3132745 RepID=UPI0030B226F1
MAAGTAAGAVAGTVAPAAYTAESRVAVGSNDLGALSIPGYVFASQQMAASMARYVDNAAALDALGPALGDAEGSAVSASPIPDSNVIRLEVTTSDPDAAVRGASALTDYLVAEVAEVNSSSDADAFLAAYTALSQEVAAATSARDEAVRQVEAAEDAGAPAQEVRSQLVTLESELSVLQTRAAALQAQYEQAVTGQDLDYQLVVVADSAPSYDTETSSLQRYGLLGLVGGGLAALLAAVLLERRRTGTSSDAEAEADVETGADVEAEADVETGADDRAGPRPTDPADRAETSGQRSPGRESEMAGWRASGGRAPSSS